MDEYSKKKILMFNNSSLSSYVILRLIQEEEKL